MTRIGQILVCLLLVAGAYGAVRWINATEPKAQRVGATKETAMLVEVEPASQGDFAPEIVVVGTVEPAREVMLRPRVAGTVIKRGTNFVPGGFVAEDETLVELDPTDFETAKRARKAEFEQAQAQRIQAQAEVKRIEAEILQVRAERKQAEAELEQAQAALRVEEGRQLIARRDYELLGEKLDEQQRRLALREPQLAAARAEIASVRTRIAAADARILAAEARIKAAEASFDAGTARLAVVQAAVDQAQNEFERATIKSPFEAHVLERMADKGSEVSASDEIAHLVGVEEYWVIASVPLSKLRWIRFPKGDTPGSEVYIHHEAAWGKGRRRVGRVKNLIGTLDRTTRLARVLVVIKDPLARTPDPEQPNRPALVVGALVEVRIQAERLQQVVRIRRAHLRKDNTVWTMKDGKLDIRKVDVVFQDPDHAYLRAGLEGGARVVRTNLATVAQGAPLRTEGAKEAGTTNP